MLDAAFGNWIDLLTERGFDEAFLSLLRSHGFFDVHFTHGPYEFGKDVIAKRNDGGQIVQYAFQLKAGDISGSTWDSIFAQLFELLGARLTHPNFDSTLPRGFRLVTTGRLVGKAIQSANEFAEEAQRRNASFQVEDRDSLLGLLRGVGASDTIAARSPRLEVAIGRIAGGKVNEIELEEILGQLIPMDSADEKRTWRTFLDLSICARSLAVTDRPFLSLYAILNAIRLGAVVSHFDFELGRRVLHESMHLYVGSGQELLKSFIDSAGEPGKWIQLVHGQLSPIVTYPIASCRVAEFLGLSALFSEELGRSDDADRFSSLLVTVVEKQPGLVHLISDRHITSLSAAAYALARSRFPNLGKNLLIPVLNWICDRYENHDSGLAGPYADPEAEVRTLFGAPFAFVALARRRESLAAAALLDLAHTFVPENYADMLNDVLAAGLVPTAIHANDHPDAYFVHRQGQTKPLANIRYPEGSTEVLPHFQLQAEPRTPERAGGPATLLGLAVLTRDRLFSDCFPRIRPSSYRSAVDTSTSTAR